jgi:hypothetical protein
MPHPKGNMKLSGDIHLPDVESDLAVEQGHTGLEALANERTQPGRTAARKAGLVADPDLGTTSRLAHVTRGEPIAPGSEPLAGYQEAPQARRAPRVPLKSLGLAFVAGLLLYKLVR